MGIQYKDVQPVGTGLIIAGVFFFLGLILGNLPYDIHTLFTTDATDEAFANSLQHYKTWYSIPAIGLWTIHGFLGVGFLGLLIKVYNPANDTKYFEYGSLFLYVVAVCIYLTNLKTGAEAALTGIWGEVDEHTGINVIAASEYMIVFLLGGIVILQAGLYYAEWDYQQRLAIFNKEEAEREAEEAAAAVTEAAEKPKTKKTTTAKVEPKAESTASPKTRSQVKKRKA